MGGFLLTVSGLPAALGATHTRSCGFCFTHGETEALSCSLWSLPQAFLSRDVTEATSPSSLSFFLYDVRVQIVPAYKAVLYHDEVCVLEAQETQPVVEHVLGTWEALGSSPRAEKKESKK